MYITRPAVIVRAAASLMITIQQFHCIVMSAPPSRLQDNQRDLEMATEFLSEYLERDITKDTLSNMKTMVQDKTK